MASNSIRIPITYLQVFLATAKELGHRVPTEWFATSHVALLNGNTQVTSISLEDTASIIGTIVTKTKDPRLSFEFGQRLTLNRHGFLGYAAGSAKTLRDMIQLEARYFDTQVAAIRFQLEEFETFFNTNIYIDAEPAHIPLYMEILLSSSQKILTDLGIPKKLMRYSYANLAYPKPEYGHFYEQYLSFSLRFDQPHNGFSSNAALLELTNSYYDPTLNSVTMERLSHLSRKEQSLLTNLERYIKSNLTVNPSLEEAADILHVSSRTLKRRLAEHGLTFSGMLLDARLNTAKDLLQSSRLSIEAVSHRVGYAHSSSFINAFRRKFGEPPTSWANRR